MKKLVALMLIFFFLFGCATTIIKSIPSEANIYNEEKLLGKTPYTFKSAATGGTKWIMTLKKEGYKDNLVQIKKDKADIGMIILGCFFIVPFLWWGTFPTEYIFEMEKL